MKGNADSIGQQFSTSKTFESVSIQENLTNSTGTGSASCSESQQGLGTTATPNVADCDPGTLPTTAVTAPPAL